MTSPPSRAVSAYAGGVGVLGVAVAVASCVLRSPVTDLRAHSWQLTALVAALVLGELATIKLPRRSGSTSSITVSTSFAVALVAVGPLSVDMAAIVLAVLVDDLRQRRSFLQVLFNAGQYCLSLAAARVVFSALTGEGLLSGYSPLRGQDLPWTLAAGVVFAVCNDVLVCGVVARVRGGSLRDALNDDVGFRLQTSALLIALAPLAAFLVEDSEASLVLLVMPILAIGRAAHLAVAREHESLVDAATGLANRRRFRTLVAGKLAAEPAQGLAVAMIDLDHFRDVNDALGREVGDDVLRAVGQRLSAAASDLGADAVVARVGGDEFAVLFSGSCAPEDAAGASTVLRDVLAIPIEVAGTAIALAASVGWTTTGPSSGTTFADAPEALQQADLALREAKRDRTRVAGFSPRMVTGSAERVRMLPQLQEAIGAGQLHVLFQPQVDSASGSITSAEALVRWDHPEWGRLAPAVFIDLAETTGLIEALTTEVLRQALASAARWRAQGTPVGVSVNVSARQLSDTDLPQHVAELLTQAGVPAGLLTVEVTESSLMADPTTAAAVLAELRDLGVKLSIDDFGTGYSSLVLLQQLAVDELKVDRSFVTGMTPGSHDEVLVRSILELGHNLGLTVVAEGVETQAVAEHLRELGADLLQGWLYGRPVEEAELSRSLRAQSQAESRPTSTAGHGHVQEASC